MIAVASGYFASDNTHAIHNKAGCSVSLIAGIPVIGSKTPEEIMWPFALLTIHITGSIQETILPVDVE